MVKKLRAVLDTNVIVSGVIYKGKPRRVLELSLEEKIKAVISPILLAELAETLAKKFSLTSEQVNLTEQEIKDVFEIVYPTETLHIQKDEDDNRVLEAAVEGNCNYIVTGDKELLNLGIFKGIKILTAAQFLNILGKS